MTAFSLLPTHPSGELQAVRGFLAGLLEAGLAEAVLVPVETGDGRSVQPALIRDPARIARANPFLPVLPVSGARMISLLTRRAAPNGAEAGRIAVVLRPCELRAAVELAKLHQVSPERILTIGIDCVGTYEGSVLKEAAEPGGITTAVLEAARLARQEAPEGATYRPACAICDTPAPWSADVSLHLIGVRTGDGILVEVADETLLGPLGLPDGADPALHREAVEALIAERRQMRAARLDAVKAEMHPNGVPGIVAVFETCQRCFNCTVACPICYCKECLFRTEVFDHEPGRYQNWARQKGATRLPGDTIAFQLTRLTHVTASCVGCGLCTSACPADLQVDALFQTVARDVQALFDYVPGRDPGEPLPAAAFRQDEFVALGETEH